jgi:pimeloyl-ACP methyl ester carboxylesterase
MALPGFPRAMQAVGLLAVNPEFFAEVLGEFRTIDWGRYLRLMLRLNEHSAAAYLREVAVPTLITAGTHDRMTPLALAEQMRDAIAGAELLVVPRSTHYTPAEFPDVLVRGIDAFLRRADPDAFGTAR